MAAPVVQSLAEVMAELNPTIAAGEGIINQQRAGLGAKYDTQRQGLTAEKGQGFNTINNQATGRGLSFSGIPIDEQATYLSTKYLPAYAQTFNQQNDEDLGLQKESAANQREIAGQAIGIRNTQQSALNSYNSQIDQQNFQREQSALDRSASAASQAKSAAPPTQTEYLSQLFASNFNDDTAKSGWTENVAAGNFASAYGLSRKDALAQIYSFRKQYYGV